LQKIKFYQNSQSIVAQANAQAAQKTLPKAKQRQRCVAIGKGFVEIKNFSTHYLLPVIFL
jgi:hypothetical protein